MYDPTVMQEIKTQSSKLKVQNHNLKLKTELKYRCYYFSIEIIKLINKLPEKKFIGLFLTNCSVQQQASGQILLKQNQQVPKEIL